MGIIECILDEVKNLSDSDLKILVNKIMYRLNLEKAFASPAKVNPRMDRSVCHIMRMLLETVTNMISRHVGNHMLQRATHFLLACMIAALSGKTFLADTLMGVSLDDTMNGLKLRHIKISHTSLFFMRHKIMLALEDLQEISPAMIEDVVEADETYVPESEK